MIYAHVHNQTIIGVSGSASPDFDGETGSFIFDEPPFDGVPILMGDGTQVNNNDEYMDYLQQKVTAIGRIYSEVEKVTYASQVTWVIDPENGDDANRGSSTETALKTCMELRRRMRACGGHITDNTTITLKSTLSEIDSLYLDWGSAPGLNIYVRGIAPVCRSGYFTAAPQGRTDSAPNIIQDTQVNRTWGKDVCFSTGKVMRVTSGIAENALAFVSKNSGNNHEAEVSSFLPVDGGLEMLPGDGDTYDILSMPFIKNYFIAPESGRFTFNFLNLGDGSSDNASIAPSVTTEGLRFINCCIYRVNVSQSPVVDLMNCCIKTPLYISNGTLNVHGGCVGDISDDPTSGKVGTAGELTLAIGVLFQGVRGNTIDMGYVNFIDAQIFDSPDAGWTVGTGGICRITKLTGSRNVNVGILVSNSGTVFGNLSQCKVTGIQGDVDFCGTIKSWAELTLSVTTKSITGIASIGPE